MGPFVWERVTERAAEEKVTGKILGGAMAAVLLLALSFSASARELPPDGLLDFAVIRDGEVIGHHRVAFRQEGPTTLMVVEAKIEITLLGITVYRFLHSGRETWRGGRLIDFHTTTDDDGDRLMVEARRNGAGDFDVRNSDQALVAPGKTIPSSLWHLGILQARAEDRLLHTITGELLPMKVTGLGRREVETGAGLVAAEGYFVDARPDFHRELWYDEAGLLAAAALTAADGSSVRLVRQSPVTARVAEQARIPEHFILSRNQPGAIQRKLKVH